MYNNYGKVGAYPNEDPRQQYNYYNQKASSSGDELDAFRQMDEGINHINEPTRP